MMTKRACLVGWCQDNIRSLHVEKSKKKTVYGLQFKGGPLPISLVKVVSSTKFLCPHHWRPFGDLEYLNKKSSSRLQDACSSGGRTRPPPHHPLQRCQEFLTASLPGTAIQYVWQEDLAVVVWMAEMVIGVSLIPRVDHLISCQTAADIPPSNQKEQERSLSTRLGHWTLNVIPAHSHNNRCLLNHSTLFM